MKNSASSPSSSCTSSSACVLPTESKSLKPKRARRAKKTQNPTSPVSTRRSSIYRGVTRHRWTLRFEAHLWDKSSWNSIQNKKGKQVYLGAYDNEESAAHTYDLAALKYWGPDTILNFPVETYTKEIVEMQRVTKEEYLASLRRQSSGFSRGVSKYRGVARHHHNGRWEARIGRVMGNKYLYLGTYNTQEEAAAAYDMAAIEHRGANAVTNFDISNYIDRLKLKGIFPWSQTNQQEASFDEAIQELEAKEEPIEEVKQCVEVEEPEEEKIELVEEIGYKQVAAADTCWPKQVPVTTSWQRQLAGPTSYVRSSVYMETDRCTNGNELAWDYCMMDSAFPPLLTDQMFSNENPIEYPELFNEIEFESNIDSIFEEVKNESLSFEDVIGRESPTSLSSPFSYFSTDSAQSATTSVSRF